jgi:serralysin
VLRINAMGVFFETDHVIDDPSTRFAHTAAFDGFVAQGRMFIAAAGSDAGVTIFELLPDGQLSHLQTFVLEGGFGLQAVTAINAAVMGGTVALSVVDAGANQIFRFDLDLGNLGARIQASAGMATGTGADERLLGSALADAISGGAGDDFLHDGAGSDTLTGGAGADIFVFARDGAVDTVSDFQDGVDLIDIRDWGRIYSASALTILSTATGAEVMYGDERVIITSSTGTPFNATTFNDSDFIF